MKNLFKIVFITLISIELSLILITILIDFSETSELPESYFLDIDNSWADTLLKRMSLEEKIGQLFVLELNNAKSDSKEKLDSLIQEFAIGGIKFQKTEILNQLIITNFLQAKSKFPLLVGSEGSIINRGDFNFPVGPIINSVNGSQFTNYYLKEFSEVAQLEGVNIEFSNSFNPIDSLFNGYGFSVNDSIQFSQSEIFRKRLHNNKVISCLNLNDNLFYPNDSILSDSLKIFKKSINKFFAVQLSPQITNFIISQPKHQAIADYLNHNYKFKGLIYTNINDSISDNSLFSLYNSGVDGFIINDSLKNSINTFRLLVEKGRIKVSDIDNRVKRILLAKNWAGLDKQEFKSAENSFSKIIGHQRKLLSWQLYESSVCLLKNQGNLLPFSNLLNNSTCLLEIGNVRVQFLKEYLSNYIDFSISQYKAGDFKTSSYSVYRNIIIAITDADSAIVNPTLIQSLKKLKQQKNIIIVNLGKPTLIQELDFAQAIIYVYDNHPFSQIIAAQIIAGSIEPQGLIKPYNFKAFKGKVSYKKTDRFQYTIPEATGFNSIELEKVDRLIASAIGMRAMPGCQVLAAKDGKVFYNKSFGYLGYGAYPRVENADIYDIASISKVAATTLASMKLYEEGKIGLNDSIKYYIEDTINCTIKNHQLRDFFLHQSGLPADMPILKYIRYRNKYTKRFDKYYSEKRDTSYSIEVADKFFLRKDYVDSVVLSLYNLEWDTTKVYNYSDINFNIIYDIILRKIKEKYTDYLSENFYNPLQLRTIGFKPLERFDKERIAPTQEDKYWRKQLLQGYPHDESAAIYGGVSGNAGLFSNANDLAIIFQMLLNGGTYGGKQIFKKETIDLFTSSQDDSPRGLGFARSKGGAFGHSGFTGCVVWANPTNRTIFVFLSNGIHPNVMNKKLKKLEIREKVYDLIMQAYKPGSGVLKIGE